MATQQQAQQPPKLFSLALEAAMAQSRRAMSQQPCLQSRIKPMTAFRPQPHKRRRGVLLTRLLRLGCRYSEHADTRLHSQVGVGVFKGSPECTSILAWNSFKCQLPDTMSLPSLLCSALAGASCVNARVREGLLQEESLLLSFLPGG